MLLPKGSIEWKGVDQYNRNIRLLLVGFRVFECHLGEIDKQTSNWQVPVVTYKRLYLKFCFNFEYNGKWIKLNTYCFSNFIQCKITYYSIEKMASEMAPSLIVLGTFLGLAIAGSNAYRLFNEDFKVKLQNTYFDGCKPRKVRQGQWGYALEQRDEWVKEELKKEAKNVNATTKGHSTTH